MSGSITGRTEIRTHPDSRIGWAGSRHDNISTLTNPESNHIRNVWLHRHKVVGNNRHIKAVNSKTLNTLSATVDKPQSMFLSGSELELGKAGIRRALLGFIGELSAVEAHLAVDQVAVGKRGKWTGRRGHHSLDNLFVGLVIPVAEEDWSNVDIVCYLGWAVDDHRARKTGRVLGAIVRVVPRCAVKIRKELIGHTRSRSNRALVYGRNTVVPRGLLL